MTTRKRRACTDDEPLFCASCDCVLGGFRIAHNDSGFVLCGRCATHNKKQRRKPVVHRSAPRPARRERTSHVFLVSSSRVGSQTEPKPPPIASYWLEAFARAQAITEPTHILDDLYAKYPPDLLTRRLVRRSSLSS